MCSAAKIQISEEKTKKILSFFERDNTGSPADWLSCQVSGDVIICCLSRLSAESHAAVAAETVSRWNRLETSSSDFLATVSFLC